MSARRLYVQRFPERLKIRLEAPKGPGKNAMRRREFVGRPDGADAIGKREMPVPSSLLARADRVIG